MSSALISSADASRIAIPAEDEDVAALRQSVVTKLTYAVGRDPIVATDWDWFMAAALAVRDHVLERWLASTRANYISQGKRVYYLSLEFLIGRLLHDSLNNLGLVDRMRAALAELGVDYDRLRNVEHDAALGNGGLGRLAACFMESMATLQIAAHGYGIRYDHGMFRQVIKDGWQHEYPENWLTFGNPWEVTRPDATHVVGFGGTVETRAGADGTTCYVWHPAEAVDAVAYDTPVVGWRGHYANTLRLWSARAADPLRLDAFNRGDHIRALEPQGPRERHIAGAVSERRDPGRPGTAAAPGILLHLGVAPGPRPAAHAPAQGRHPPAARQGGDPAQRYASRHRCRRADAHPDRPARAPVGRGVAALPPTPSPTPTTRCCPRRSRAGRCR